MSVFPTLYGLNPQPTVLMAHELKMTNQTVFPYNTPIYKQPFLVK